MVPKIKQAAQKWPRNAEMTPCQSTADSASKMLNQLVIKYHFLTADSAIMSPAILEYPHTDTYIPQYLLSQLFGGGGETGWSGLVWMTCASAG